LSRQASQGERRRISPTGRPHTHQGNHCAVSVIASLTSASVDGFPYSTFFPTERLPGDYSNAGQQPSSSCRPVRWLQLSSRSGWPTSFQAARGPCSPRGIDLLDFDDVAAPWALPEYSNTPLTGSATKDYDRATDAHFRPDKPWGATGKSLIVLSPWLTLNHRVSGSSPGAPTKRFKHLAAFADQLGPEAVHIASS
jgi:hypothetical protein